MAHASVTEKENLSPGAVRRQLILRARPSDNLDIINRAARFPRLTCGRIQPGFDLHPAHVCGNRERLAVVLPSRSCTWHRRREASEAIVGARTNQSLQNTRGTFIAKQTSGNKRACAAAPANGNREAIGQPGSHSNRLEPRRSQRLASQNRDPATRKRRASHPFGIGSEAGLLTIT